ncbi:HvfC/BufC N-terminal domain-containing protein [Pararhizobium haloflavum]|uniref:HvfC/BufC N-terminal domain-containing protein n=1 Tax=Pararhizobium haloflavum TaxID=2037914 RepID=UPI0012FFED42|nr:DNA-binding domain-containing protein [Pararhizobium haloflavum]
MPSFADVQAAFAAAVIGPDVALPAGVLADPGGQQAERFAVHRNNVVSGLVEQLAASFPVVRRLVGADFFRAMARAFVLATPPRSPALMRYGDGFPGFIQRFPPASALPYLADVATLEVLRVHAYHAADAVPLTSSEAMLHLAKARPRLRPHPAAMVLRSRFPVFTIWLANQPGSLPERIRATKAETVLIARPAMTVNLHLIEEVVADVFDALPRRALNGEEIGDVAVIGQLANWGALIKDSRETRQ